MKRSRLNPMSDAAKKKLSARRACIAAVKERDKSCQFWSHLNAWLALNAGRFPWPYPQCGGPPEVHEPAHRRNVDFTDPTNCLLLCRSHNQWCEDQPTAAREIGLVVHGNGLPLRK